MHHVDLQNFPCDGGKHISVGLRKIPTRDKSTLKRVNWTLLQVSLAQYYISNHFDAKKRLLGKILGKCYLIYMSHKNVISSNILLNLIFFFLITLEGLEVWNQSHLKTLMFHIEKSNRRIKGFRRIKYAALRMCTRVNMFLLPLFLFFCSNAYIYIYIHMSACTRTHAITHKHK